MYGDTKTKHDRMSKALKVKSEGQETKRKHFKGKLEETNNFVRKNTAIIKKLNK